MPHQDDPLWIDLSILLKIIHDVRQAPGPRRNTPPFVCGGCFLASQFVHAIAKAIVKVRVDVTIVSRGETVTRGRDFFHGPTVRDTPASFG